MKNTVLIFLLSLCSCQYVSNQVLNKFRDLDIEFRTKKYLNADSLYTLITDTTLLPKKVILKKISDSASAFIELCINKIDTLSSHKDDDLNSTTKVMLVEGRAFALKKLIISFDSFIIQNLTKKQLAEINFKPIETTPKEKSTKWEDNFNMVPTIADKTLLDNFLYTHFRRYESAVMSVWVKEQSK